MRWLKMRIVEFVLQRHDAKKAGLHVDLRLRYPYKQSLASWALPKANIPQTTGDRMLAVRTSDHPMDWMNFHGTIPEGSGGAGTVEIIQSGKAEIMEWTNKLISFRVEGPIMNGRYALILMKRGNKPGQTQWLLIKGKDT